MNLGLRAIVSSRCALIALVFAVSTLACATQPVAQGTPKVARVGILSPEENDHTPAFVAFRQGLRDLGYEEGKSIVLDFRLAKGHNESLGQLATELVQIPVDVIVAGGITAVRAAARTTPTIPIIQAAGGDLVAAGLATSIARPDRNVTGFTIRPEEPSAKRLELLKRAFPNIRRVSVVLDPTGVPTELMFRATERAAATLNIELTKVPIGTPEELEGLDARTLAGSEGLVVLPSAMFWNHRLAIIKVAAAARLPAIYPEREYATDGGLAAYGANIPDSFRRAATYVDRLLHGSKPGDLPIEQASKFDFVVNLQTAQKLGMSLSPDFLGIANEVIE
jgi:putative tryptophan/tyrosine transport system substrate-binding protein